MRSRIPLLVLARALVAAAFASSIALATSHVRADVPAPSQAEPPSPAPAPPSPPSPPEPPPAASLAPTLAAPAQPATPPPAIAPPLPWAGTTFTWEHAVSATLLGIGPKEFQFDLAGEYRMTFALSPGVFVFWHPRHQIRLSTRLAVSKIVVDNDPDSTTARKTTALEDLPITLTYAAIAFTSGEGTYPIGPAAMRDPTLLGSGDYRTWIIPTTEIAFPTSVASRALGTSVSSAIGLSIRQQLKILGAEAPLLQHIFLTVREIWSHQFAHTVTTRYDGFPDPFAYTTPTINQLTHTAELMVPLYRALELHALFGLQQALSRPVPDPGPQCISLSVGCVPLQSATGPATIDTSSFEVDVAYRIIPELSVRLGYANTALTTGLILNNGEREGSFFYSPNAVFFGDVAFSFDALYGRLTGRK